MQSQKLDQERRQMDTLRQILAEGATPIHAVVSHHQMHDDELRGDALIRRFGPRLFRGLRSVRSANLMLVDSGGQNFQGKTALDWARQGYLLIGCGGGPLDEHGKIRPSGEAMCAATLVARLLRIEGDPVVAKILKQATRVDQTATARPFDLSRILKNLHRYGGVHPEYVHAMFREIDNAQFAYLSGEPCRPDWEECLNPVELTVGWLKQLSVRLRARSKGVIPQGADLPTAVDILGFGNNPGLKKIVPYIHGKRPTTQTDIWELNGILWAMAQHGTPQNRIREILYCILDAFYRREQAFDAAMLEASACVRYREVPGGRVLFMDSSNIEIQPAILYLAGQHHVNVPAIVTRNSDNGHVMVSFATNRGMRDTVRTWRLREYFGRGGRGRIQSDLTSSRTIPEVPNIHWFEDGRQILNGCLTAPSVRGTCVPLEEVAEIVAASLGGRRAFVPRRSGDRRRHRSQAV
jgi:hypothetical protein